MLHHYLEFMEVEAVAEAEAVSAALTAEYLELEAGTFNGYQRRHSVLCPATTAADPRASSALLTPSSGRSTIATGSKNNRGSSSSARNSEGISGTSDVIAAVADYSQYYSIARPPPILFPAF
jgi:hypothetical protein